MKAITSQNEKKKFKFIIIRDWKKIISNELLDLKAQKQAEWNYLLNE